MAKSAKAAKGGKGGKGSSLPIVASGAVTQALVQICRPTTDVAIQGSIVNSGGKPVLVIDNIRSAQRTSVAIVANSQATSKLANLSKGGGKQPIAVTLSGRVVDGGGGSALVLDNVSQCTSLPLVASASTQQALSELASNGEGEITVKAKVTGSGANRLLVLEPAKGR